PPYWTQLRRRRAPAHEPNHRLVRPGVVVLSDQVLVEALDAIGPTRLAIPVLQRDPGPDHPLQRRASRPLPRTATQRRHRAPPQPPGPAQTASPRSPPEYAKRTRRAIKPVRESGCPLRARVERPLTAEEAQAPRPAPSAHHGASASAPQQRPRSRRSDHLLVP